MSGLVVGSGIFGVAAALALRARGHEVRLLDHGPIPYTHAESTDMSKVVRLDYGADEALTKLMETALERWRDWNERWERPLFHETGVFFAAESPMAPGGFEHDSMEVLLRRGHRVERLDAEGIARRFPAFARGVLVDGYFNPQGGWVESEAVVAELAKSAATAGVVVEAGVRVQRLLERGSRITGVVLAGGETREADVVVVTAGSWTMKLCPWLQAHLRASAQPVFFLATPEPPSALGPFPVFGADIAKTGWYGFPPSNGFVKIANHGPGRALDPDDVKRVVTQAELASLRAFTKKTIPILADAAVPLSRMCIYCDTADGNFWIAPDPERPGLVVATGGSGHAFKFGPVLGDIIADAVEGSVDPRFRWRTDALAVTTEAARAR